MWGTTIGVIKGDTRSLEYSSHGLIIVSRLLGGSWGLSKWVNNGDNWGYYYRENSKWVTDHGKAKGSYYRVSGLVATVLLGARCLRGGLKSSCARTGGNVMLHGLSCPM